MRRNWFTSLLSAIWRVMDGTRKVLHFVLLATIALMLVALLAPKAPLVPRRAALVIAPEGSLVDQLSGDAVTRAWDEVTGRRVRESLVKDMLDAIEAGSGDPRIEALVLQLDGMGSAGVSTLQDIGGAIQEFKASGKPVIAIGDFFSQNQFYLAAHADEIYLHPNGFVFMQGFGTYRSYYRDVIDKLYIDWNVFRVGEYKSIVEPYVRNDMSPETKENSLDWLRGLWTSYQRDVTGARGLDADALERYTERLPAFLRETGGDLALLALDTGLVDALRTHDAMNARVIEIVGEDESSHRFNQIHYSDYVAHLRLGGGISSSDKLVGVIVASGDILDGSQPPGSIGSESAAALIRHARHDERVKAVVMRVDSGGGSAFASEIIGRELELLREAGKPVVASMGDVAASGGYWLAMEADEIWANPNSITGSIGIAAWFPTFQRTLDKLGIHVDGVGTTRWSGEFRPDRELGEGAREVLQLSIENGYQRFIAEVAESRDMSIDRVHEVAKGKVWLGEQAQAIGLVDYLGDLDEAIASAADLAGIAEEYDVDYIQKEPSFREALSMQVARAGQALFGRVGLPRAGSSLMQAAESLKGELEALSRWNDPLGLYYHCLCDVR